MAAAINARAVQAASMGSHLFAFHETWTLGLAFLISVWVVIGFSPLLGKDLKIILRFVFICPYYSNSSVDPRMRGRF
jgi:hypothetical protein